MKVIFIVFIVLLGLCLFDRVMLMSESKKITPYGHKIEVMGGKMNVVEKGEEHPQTIVFLPGYGTSAPALDFAPLMDELAKDYHVVAIEPFGYGDSDGTDRPRTIDNITEEFHLATLQLGLHDYILCGHSISGIYSIYYLNRYPGEVAGFVGLDTSVPNQLKHEPNIFSHVLRKCAKELGWIRVANTLYPQGFRATGDGYSEDVKTQIKYRVNRDFANDTNLDEADHFEANWAKVEHLYYPKEIQKIFFLSKRDEEEAPWRTIETRNAFLNHNGKIYELEGGHYIHRDQFMKIAEEIRGTW